MSEHVNGRPSWGMPSPGEILLRIEGRLGGLETGQAMTLTAVKEGFRKIDHAHARITRVEESLAHLRAATSSETGRPSEGPIPPPMGMAALLIHLTGLSTTIREVLPLVAVILWLLAALGAAIDPELPRALIGIER